jgi:SAM-dependent methyltransferase
MNSIPNEINLEDINCPNGCKKNDLHVLAAKDRLHNLPGNFDIVKCSHCKLMRTNPRPDSESIGYYYPDSYEPYNVELKKVEKKGFKRIVSSFFQRWDSNAIPDLEPGNMLEFGCANGTFLELMSQKDWSVRGIEFSELAANKAIKKGFDVSIGAIEEISNKENEFDMVVGWMVLEHLHDPVNALKKIKTWTKPNGYLVISIPDISGFDFKLFKHNWYSLHLPAHLYHFTPSSIKSILQLSGWQIEKIVWHRNPDNLLRSIGYWAEEKNYQWFAKLIERVSYKKKYPALNSLLGVLLALTKQSGRISVYAVNK